MKLPAVELLGILLIKCEIRYRRSESVSVEKPVDVNHLIFYCVKKINPLKV